MTGTVEYPSTLRPADRCRWLLRCWQDRVSVPALEVTPFDRVLWEAFNREIKTNMEIPELSDDRWITFLSYWERTGKTRRLWPEMGKLRREKRDTVSAANAALDTLNVARALGIGDSTCPLCGRDGVQHHVDKKGKSRWKHALCGASGGPGNYAEAVLGQKGVLPFLEDAMRKEIPAPAGWAESREDGEEVDDTPDADGSAPTIENVSTVWGECAALREVKQFVRVSGDILLTPADIRVVAVNCVGVMGAGIALQVKEACPEFFAVYKRACDRGDARPGTIVCEEAGWVGIATKDDWRDPSCLEWVDSGLAALRELLSSRDVATVAVPALGCGCGGLAWEDVSPRVRKYLEGLKACVLSFLPEKGDGPAAVPQAVSAYAVNCGWDPATVDAREKGADLVTPLRDARGEVRNLQFRSVETGKARLYRNTAEVLAYGEPHELAGAHKVVLTVGSADTHAAMRVVAGARARAKRVHVSDAYDVYAGRPSVYGNPWSHFADSAADFQTKTRGESLRNFGAWLRGELNVLPDRLAALLAALDELRDMRIACHCGRGEACHVDILIRFLEERDRVVCVGAPSARDLVRVGRLVGPNARLLIAAQGGETALEALLYGGAQKPGKVLAVSGHRILDVGLDRVAEEALAVTRPSKVLTGMAVGWDQAVARACVKMSIPFTAAVPCDDYDAVWPEHARVAYEVLLRQAEHVEVVCSGPYREGVLRARNEWVARNAEGTIALYDGREKGGTAGDVRGGKHAVWDVWPLWTRGWKVFDGGLSAMMREVGAERAGEEVRRQFE